MRQKAADEIFCRSCGEPIKKKAEICPNCGVRNENASSSGVNTSRGPSPTHDPSQYETTVSDTWWYGVVGGIILWMFVIALSGTAGDSMGAFGGILAMIAWIGLPLAAYYDMQYIRANGKWNPDTALWVLILAIWFINIVAGAVYLYRRHEVLDVP